MKTDGLLLVAQLSPNQTSHNAITKIYFSSEVVFDNFSIHVIVLCDYLYLDYQQRKDICITFSCIYYENEAHWSLKRQKIMIDNTMKI